MESMLRFPTHRHDPAFLRIHFPRFSLSDCHDSWLCETQTDSIEVRGKRKFCKHSCEDKALQLKIFSVWWRSKILCERNSGRTAKFAAFVKDSSFCSRWNVVNHRNKFSTTPEMRVFLEFSQLFTLARSKKLNKKLLLLTLWFEVYDGKSSNKRENLQQQKFVGFSNFEIDVCWQIFQIGSSRCWRFLIGKIERIKNYRNRFE